MRPDFSPFARVAKLAHFTFAPAVLCAAVLASVSAPAHAAGNDAYIGFALGPSKIDIDCGLTTSCDDGDTGFKLYVGFDLPRAPLPHLAFEAAYISFGKAVGHYTSFGQHTVEVSALAFDAALRGQLVPNLSAVGRLGLAYVSGKSSGNVLLSSSSDSGLEPHLGLGLEYALNKQFKVTGGLDFTSYDTGKESGSARLLSIGVQMGF